MAAIAGAGIAGVPLAKITYDSTKLLNAKQVQASAAFLQRLMPDVDSFDNTISNANKILDKTGLGKKGVKLFVSDNTPESDHVLDSMFGKFTENKLIKNFKKLIQFGGNSAYLPDNKTIVMSDKALYTAVYHELGHASNANGNKFTKLLQKSRILTPLGLPIIAPLVLAASLLHNVDKSKSSEEKSKKEKTLDFVSKNAGKLTFATYLPILAEEALASVKGVKYAKEFLKPEQLTKLKGNYKKAFGTYAQVAVITSAAVGLASIVADKIRNGSKHNHKIEDVLVSSESQYAENQDIE